jgi:hypothetical protein
MHVKRVPVPLECAAVEGGEDRDAVQRHHLVLRRPRGVRDRVVVRDGALAVRDRFLLPSWL